MSLESDILLIFLCVYGPITLLIGLYAIFHVCIERRYPWIGRVLESSYTRDTDPNWGNYSASLTGYSPRFRDEAPATDVELGLEEQVPHAVRQAQLKLGPEVEHQSDASASPPLPVAKAEQQHPPLHSTTEPVQREAIAYTLRNVPNKAPSHRCNTRQAPKPPEDLYTIEEGPLFREDIEYTMSRQNERSFGRHLTPKGSGIRKNQEVEAQSSSLNEGGTQPQPQTTVKYPSAYERVQRC